MSVSQKVLLASIGAVQAVSGGVLLGDYTLCGMFFPANWTGTPTISYQISLDGGATWVELNDDTGAPVAYPVATAAGKYFALNPQNSFLSGATLVRIRSGTLIAPALQSNAVVVQVVGRRTFPGV